MIIYKQKHDKIIHYEGIVQFLYALYYYGKFIGKTAVNQLTLLLCNLLPISILYCSIFNP